MHRSWNPCFPYPWGVARHSKASCWPPVCMESHGTQLNVCTQHGAPCRGNDSKLKIKKRLFSSFLCVIHSVCFTRSYRCTKIYTTSIFAVFKSLMFDWPYTKFWMFSHIHLWESHWWLFFGNYWKIYMYTPFLWIQATDSHTPHWGLTTLYLKMMTRIECPPDMCCYWSH